MELFNSIDASFIFKSFNYTTFPKEASYEGNSMQAYSYTAYTAEQSHLGKYTEIIFCIS